MSEKRVLDDTGLVEYESVWNYNNVLVMFQFIILWDSYRHILPEVSLLNLIVLVNLFLSPCRDICTKKVSLV